MYALLFPEPPPAPLHVVFEAASPVEPGVLQFLLDSLASQPCSSSCLCFLSAETIGTCHCAWFFFLKCGFWRIKLKSSGLYEKHFTAWDIPQISSFKLLCSIANPPRGMRVADLSTTVMWQIGKTLGSYPSSWKLRKVPDTGFSIHHKAIYS